MKGWRRGSTPRISFEKAHAINTLRKSQGMSKKEFADAVGIYALNITSYIDPDVLDKLNDFATARSIPFDIHSYP
jgi:hypothetical protein